MFSDKTTKLSLAFRSENWETRARAIENSGNSWCWVSGSVWSWISACLDWNVIIGGIEIQKKNGCETARRGIRPPTSVMAKALVVNPGVVVLRNKDGSDFRIQVSFALLVMIRNLSACKAFATSPPLLTVFAIKVRQTKSTFLASSPPLQIPIWGQKDWFVVVRSRDGSGATSKK